jgi:hypothetical protein
VTLHVSCFSISWMFEIFQRSMDVGITGLSSTKSCIIIINVAGSLISSLQMCCLVASYGKESMNGVTSFTHVRVTNFVEKVFVPRNACLVNLKRSATFYHTESEQKGVDFTHNFMAVILHGLDSEGIIGILHTTREEMLPKRLT